MNRNHLNLGLLVAVAGLGTAAWLGQKPDEEKKPPLTALTPSMVQTIALEHPGSPTIRLAKQDGQWAITEPVKAAADPFEVNALVGLSDTGVQMKLDSGDLKELGLVPARYRITINDQTIDFGGEEPLKYRRYVRVNEKELALIADPGSAAFDADYSDLVAKDLIPAGAAITRIVVPGLTLEKSADGAWASPDHADAKADQLKAIADAWTSAKALFNGSLQPEDAQGEAATLTLADGRTLSFTIAARDPQLVLARADLGVRYTLSRADIDTLLQLPAPKPADAAPADAAATPVTPAAPTP